MDPDEQHLLALHKELAHHGVRSVLYTHGIRPRLRIYCPDERPGCSFDNNVIAAALAGQWIFWWPWAEPIGPAAELARTAATIIDELDLRDEGHGESDAPVTVPSLAVQRKRRQAQAGALHPQAR